MSFTPQCDRQVYDCLKDAGFVEVTETEFDHDFKQIVVECDECGNTTTTSHFFCGEFLPISMYCVRCRKHTPCHSRYAECVNA